MKHYNIAALLLLIIVAALLLFNKNILPAQQDTAITATDSVQPIAQLADISKNLTLINQRLATLGDRVASLEHQQINSRQQVNSPGAKTAVDSSVNNSAQEGAADSELALLAQETGVTATQLATMNGSEIEVLHEQQTLAQDKQYFKQLEQHLNPGKATAIDKAFEQSITDSVNLDDLSNSKISNISCDSAMCRVEVKHNDPDAMNKFLDKVPGLSLWNTEAVVDFPDTGDKPTSIIYLARKDHSLPARSEQGQ